MTNAERRVRALALLWLAIHAAVAVGLAWLFFGTPPGALGQHGPELALAWAGEVVLALCCLYFLGGIRDNYLSIVGFISFKGTTTLSLLLLTFHSSAPTLLLIGAALVDFAMAGASFVLWLRARRSRFAQMPMAFGIESSLEEEPDDGRARSLRWAVGIPAAACGLASVALLACGLFVWPAFDLLATVALAHAIAVYGALSFVGLIAAETPRRYAHALDVFVLSNLVIAVGLAAWWMRAPGATPGGPWLPIVAGVHALVAIAIPVLHGRSQAAERRCPALGVWLHRAFERFAEVVLQGDVEVMTPREIADSADRLLTKIRSGRARSPKVAMAFIELGSLPGFGLPMSKLGRLERERYLEVVFQRGRGLLRDFIKVKQLVFLVYYSDRRAHREVGFVPFEERARFPKDPTRDRAPPPPLPKATDVPGDELTTDVCIVGAGAGGAVMAARLAESGRRVVIVEEGPHIPRSEITHDELDMLARAYRDGGLQTTADFDMQVLQGRCVGGSTFVNNAICMDPPREILERWHAAGARLDLAAFSESVRRVRQDLGVISLAEHQDLAQRGAALFKQGCEKLRLSSGWFDLNLPGCLGCGHCTSGCPYGRKTSVDISFIPRATAAGATVIADCKAERIGFRKSTAYTVECQRSDGRRLVVKADRIVVAGGAIASSLLLLRSGIRRNVGTRLSFNLGSWVCAEFAQPVDQFDGIQMCNYHERPTYILETLALPPGSFAASMPNWFREHFDRMLRYRHYALCGVLVGSQPIGRVKLTKLPFLRDFLSPIDFATPIPDLRKIKDGIRQAARVFLAAGALRVFPPTYRPFEITSPRQLDRLDEYVIEPDDISLGSAHPQGGNPMNDDPALGAVDSDCRVHGFDNLYVCDASVFPTSIRANPQLTVMAMADYASRKLLRTPGDATGAGPGRAH